MTPKLEPNEIAQRFDVSESYYRLVESGGTVLSPSRAEAVVNVFFRLEWGALVKYLVAAQSIDSINTEADIYKQWQQIEAEMERVCILDPNLKKLYTFFQNKGFWESTNKNKSHLDPKNDKIKIKNILEGEEFYYELFNYFTIERSSDRTISNIDQAIVNKIEKSSSIIVDSVFETLNNMQSYRLNFATGDSREFEKTNSHKFTKLRAILTDFKMIISYENLKNFEYEWLWSNKFEGADMIYANLNKNESFAPHKLKNKFESNLKKVYKEKRYDSSKLKPETWKKGLNKIRFIDASSQQEDINNIITLDDYPHRVTNLWVFDYINGNKVGFVYGENNYINGLTLKYAESFTKWSQMSNLIESINE